MTLTLMHVGLSFQPLRWFFSVVGKLRLTLLLHRLVFHSVTRFQDRLQHLRFSDLKKLQAGKQT